MAIEQPSYTVCRTYPSFEIRQYGPGVVAETTVDGPPDAAADTGFRILAGYIFGGNQGDRRIAMTAPLAQTQVRMETLPTAVQAGNAGAYAIRFTMPREWTLGTLPLPLDERVALREIPARKVAVIRYSGTWARKRYQQQRERLEVGLRQAGVHWHGEAVWARYDAPWMPWFLRRNEVWLDLD